MISPGNELYETLRIFGIPGLLLALFFIFYLDAIALPTLPEFFVALIFLGDPTFPFALAMLAVLSLGEFLGITTLYLIFRKKELPGWISRRIRKYSSFFILSDERMVLLNRITPVIPYLGAFIVSCNWDYRKSMLYNFIGGLAKYAAILALASFFLSFFSNQLLADVVLLVAVSILIAASWISTLLRSRKLASSRGKAVVEDR